MKSYLPRLIVLLVAFTLGVTVAVVGRYIQSGGAERTDHPDQKPFVLIIKKRANSSGSTTACH